MTNLERVHYFFRDFESPAHFIDWNYLYSVAACLGRKVHLQEIDVGIFPNIYPIIVGPPGIGKSFPTNIVCKTLASLTEVGKDGKTPVKLVSITPTCVTLEALYDFIEGSTRAVKTKHGNPEFYHHASVAFALGDEMGLLFKKKDSTSDIVSFLIAGYDCGKFEYVTKKSGKAEIQNMCVNFLGCCTPAWIAKSMTSDMIGEGFTSRCIFLWGDQERQITTRIKISPEQTAALDSVKKHYRNLAKLQGQVTETDEAFKFLDEWYHDFKANKRRVNTDSKLDFYYSRKKLHLQKVAMLLHFSEHLTMELGVESYRKALSWLNRAELDMHKALSISTRNPLAAIADKILKLLHVDGCVKWPTILAKNFDGGNVGEIRDALKFLTETQQIAGNDKDGYIIVPPPPPVIFSEQDYSSDDSGDLGPSCPAQEPSPVQSLVSV